MVAIGHRQATQGATDILLEFGTEEPIIVLQVLQLTHGTLTKIMIVLLVITLLDRSGTSNSYLSDIYNLILSDPLNPVKQPYPTKFLVVC